MECICSSRLRILISIWPNEWFQGVKCILMMMSVSGATAAQGVVDLCRIRVRVNSFSFLVLTCSRANSHVS